MIGAQRNMQEEYFAPEKGVWVKEQSCMNMIPKEKHSRKKELGGRGWQEERFRAPGEVSVAKYHHQRRRVHGKRADDSRIVL